MHHDAKHTEESLCSHQVHLPTTAQYVKEEVVYTKEEKTTNYYTVGLNSLEIINRYIL